MKSILEDLKEVLKALAYPAEWLRVAGLILLGVLLNATALRAGNSLRTQAYSRVRDNPIGQAARNDARVIRVLLVRVYKRIGGGAKRMHLSGC